MAARASGSGTLSIELVSIPVNFYPATSSSRPLSHLLHKTCGAPVQTRYYCPEHREPVPRRELTSGFERASAELVALTDAELSMLSSHRLGRIDIAEFVPETSIDPLYIEGSQYLGPAQGGERAFRLLADAMQRARRAGVGRHGVRGREQLVVVRACRGALVMHEVRYADEVRPLDEIEYPRDASPRSVESELADALIEQLSSSAFHPEKYPDEHRERVLAAIRAKSAGQPIEAPRGEPRAQVIDLFEALKRSLPDSAARWAVPASERGEGSPAPERSATGRPMPLKKAGSGRRQGRTGTGAG